MKELFNKEHLHDLGFTLIKDDGQCGSAKCKRANGMTVIWWNRNGHSCTYFGDKLEENISFGIRKDGDTRTAFSGYVFNKEQVELLLKLTM